MARLSTDKIWEFADALKQSFSTPSDTRAATVQSVDNDGTVWVVYPGASSPTPIASVGAAVEPGDYVYTQLLNGRLVLTTNKSDPASGVNRARQIANSVAQPIQRAVVIAKGIADEAKAVANAINQHFWTDDNGAHVTDVTQDEWKAAVDDGFSDLSDQKPYYNQLSNSLGILLRSGLNNLASWTRSAIAFYDGTGNTASNIVAQFGSSGAQVGKASEPHITIGNAAIQFFKNASTRLAKIEQYTENGFTGAKMNLAESGGKVSTTVQGGTYGTDAAYVSITANAKENASTPTVTRIGLISSENGEPQSAITLRANLLTDENYNQLIRIVRESSTAQTIAHGQGANVYITVAVPDGFSLAGVVGVTHSHNIAGSIGSFYVASANRVAVAITNRQTSSSGDWTDEVVTVYCLCVWTGMVRTS